MKQYFGKEIDIILDYTKITFNELDLKIGKMFR